MSLAIDRKAIVDNVTRQNQKPSRDLVPDGVDGYKGPDSEIYNPELAKKLFADAGFPGGKGFPKLTLKFNTSDNHKKIAEAAQAMWKQVLGIQVDIANMEWRILLDDQTRGNFDIVRFSWTADYMDPHTFLSVMMSESDNNKARWKNSKYDELILKSDSELDQQKRFALMKEAEKILADESPIIPFYFYTRAYLKKPYVKGFWPQFQDHHEWKYMWIDERWYKEVPTTDLEDKPWVQ
jgi:oligopeptide transport system substrate-binding protein